MTDYAINFSAAAFHNIAKELGLVFIYSGSVASIPSGWALCNGSNGTKDLRGRFVIGAGGAYAVDATGGATSSSTAVTDGQVQTGSGSLVTSVAPDVNLVINQACDSFSILNPYYALCYIQAI